MDIKLNLKLVKKYSIDYVINDCDIEENGRNFVIHCRQWKNDLYTVIRIPIKNARISYSDIRKPRMKLDTYELQHKGLTRLLVNVQCDPVHEAHIRLPRGYIGTLGDYAGRGSKS